MVNFDQQGSRAKGCAVYGVFLLLIALVLLACIVCGAAVNSWVI